MARGIRLIRRGARRASAPQPGPESLRALIAGLPPDLRQITLTHSSWVDHRAESYGRLAFLGDSVLGLAIAEHLYMRLPKADIGRLTKVHGQAVSGRACAEVAEELGLPEALREFAPENVDGGIDATSLLASERALASVCEAVIGACYLHHGFEPALAATVAAFRHQVDLASETLLDFKSALQESLARTGRKVRYEVTSESGPPHDRIYEVRAMAGDQQSIGLGAGRSKKAAEQAAAQEALRLIEAQEG